MRYIILSFTANDRFNAHNIHQATDTFVVNFRISKEVQEDSHSAIAVNTFKNFMNFFDPFHQLNAFEFRF